MNTIVRRFSLALAAAALGLLSGCASMRLIDSDVISVPAVPAGMSLQGATYRFERLPSQANNPEAGLAEQQAQAAMTAVGLVRDDAHAQLSVMSASAATATWPTHGADHSDPDGHRMATSPLVRVLAAISGHTLASAWACAFRRPPITAVKSV